MSSKINSKGGTASSDTVTVVVGYPCPQCGVAKPARYQVEDHHQSAHGEPIQTTDIIKNTRELEHDDLMKSVYKLNKQARKYADLAEYNYKIGKKATAKANSVRKKALYDLKTDILSLLYRSDVVDSIRCHKINNRLYWLFEMESWSFHVPVDHLDIDTTDVANPNDPVELVDFHKSQKANRTSRSLKESLLFIQNKLDLSANDYLSQSHLKYGCDSYFAGWSYLD